MLVHSVRFKGSAGHHVGITSMISTTQSESVPLVRGNEVGGRLGVRAEHVRRHPKVAVWLPLEHDKIFAGPRSGTS